MKEEEDIPFLYIYSRVKKRRKSRLSKMRGIRYSFSSWCNSFPLRFHSFAPLRSRSFTPLPELLFLFPDWTNKVKHILFILLHSSSFESSCFAHSPLQQQGLIAALLLFLFLFIHSKGGQAILRSLISSFLNYWTYLFHLARKVNKQGKESIWNPSFSLFDCNKKDEWELTPAPVGKAASLMNRNKTMRVNSLQLPRNLCYNSK